MNKTIFKSVFAIILGIGLVLGAFGSLRMAGKPVRAASFTVCQSGPPDCDYSVIQAAINAADDGDVIMIAAGTYSDLNTLGGLTQTVYISKSLTLRGGYTTSNAFAEPPDPALNRTILDGQSQARVIYVTGEISAAIEGLEITGGHSGPFDSKALRDQVGGGLYVVTATTVLSHNQIYSNTAPSAGAGLYASNSNLMFHNNLFQSNVATKTDSCGGAIYTVDSNVAFITNTLRHNQVGNCGAGLHLFRSTATFTGNLFLENEAGGIGGGLAASQSELYSYNNIFQANTATTGGGLAILGNIRTELHNNQFISNTVSDEGGGIYGNNTTFDNGIVIMNQNLISGNQASYNGGASWIDELEMTVTDNIVENNQAGLGGGLTLKADNLLLADNIVRYNQASDLCGGLILAGEAITGQNNTIRNNRASNGGGLCLSLAKAGLSDTTIMANEAITGAGIYLIQSTLSLTNSIIANNQADGFGGAVFLDGSSGHFWHTTVANNTGDSGLQLSAPSYNPSTLSLTNTILAGHTLGISVTGGSTATLEATLWDNASDWAGAGVIITGTTNVWGNPFFVEPTINNFHLGFGSAAIDQGINGSVVVDIDGDSRPQGAGYDLGADEYTGPSATSIIYLPIIVNQ